MLLGLTRLVVATHQPLLCAGIYTAIGFLMDLMFATSGHASIPSVVLWLVIRFALSSAYFALLSKFDRGVLHFVIMLGGFVIGLV